MARSRSSFELGGALRHASSLTEPEAQKTPFQGVALVSFAVPGAPPPAQPAPAPNEGAKPIPPPPPPAESRPMVPSAPTVPSLPQISVDVATPSAVPSLPAITAMPGTPPIPSLPTPAVDVGRAPSPVPRAAPADVAAEDAGIASLGARSTGDDAEAKRPPRLPDLTGVVSPGVRCERIVEWIAEATGATDVFIADAEGLPIAGAVAEAEAKLASSGLVATSVGSLAASIPGNASKLFETHVGEGPFFQLIGFSAGSGLFLVGLTRGTPLTPRQAHAIRLACRHALGETLGGSP